MCHALLIKVDSTLSANPSSRQATVPSACLLTLQNPANIQTVTSYANFDSPTFKQRSELSIYSTFNMVCAHETQEFELTVISNKR